MMIAGNAAALNSSTLSGHGPNEYKMKHNNSNQSIHSQKKLGSISTIRKPGAENLESSFVSAQHAANNWVYNQHGSPPDDQDWRMYKGDDRGSPNL